MIIKLKKRKKKTRSGLPLEVIRRLLFWHGRFLLLPGHREEGEEEGPCQSLPKAGSFKFREHILALERNDDPSSNKREGDGQCKVFPKGTIRGWCYLAHVHAKDTLI